MYAIIETGGKQYRVEKGDIIDVELLDAKAGEKVEFKNVLFINNAGRSQDRQPQHRKVCGPWASWSQEVKGPKVIAFKYKKRKPFRRKVGHRQRYSRVKITEIIG